MNGVIQLNQISTRSSLMLRRYVANISLSLKLNQYWQVKWCYWCIPTSISSYSAVTNGDWPFWGWSLFLNLMGLQPSMIPFSCDWQQCSPANHPRNKLFQTIFVAPTLKFLPLEALSQYFKGIIPHLTSISVELLWLFNNSEKLTILSNVSK